MLRPRKCINETGSLDDTGNNENNDSLYRNTHCSQMQGAFPHVCVGVTLCVHSKKLKNIQCFTELASPLVDFK